MESDLITKLIESLIAGGPIAILLAIAARWFMKGNEKLTDQLQIERIQRLDQMDKEIARQRTRNDECEEDRRHLHTVIAKHLPDVELTRSGRVKLPVTNENQR